MYGGYANAQAFAGVAETGGYAMVRSTVAGVADTGVPYIAIPGYAGNKIIAQTDN